MSPGRWVSVVAGSLGLGLVVGLLCTVAAPFALGARSYTVMSGSMAPAIHTGDVVINESIAPLQARAGDVVTFRDPTMSSRMITHRVRSVHRRRGRVNLVTKGDANNTVERWTVPATGAIGRVVYRVPRVGYALFYVRTKLGRLLFVVLPAVAFGVYELWRIWRPRREDDDVELAPDPIPELERLPEGELDPLPFELPAPDREAVTEAVQG